VWQNWVVDEGRESSGEVVRRYMSSRKCGCGGRCCGVFEEGGDDGCLLSGGEGVWGRVVLVFFLIGLVSRRLGRL